jgi:MinD-like ATPase involved in chromosome partitioning or flagellar assembly
MTGERYTLLGLAQVRSTWFREAARWSTAASLPIELVKTMSVEEVRARLRSGRAFSAFVVDDLVPGLDRDLFEEAHEAGCAVIVVDGGRTGRRWSDLDVAAVLPADFDASTLLQVLDQVAQPVRGLATTAVAAADALSSPPSLEEPEGRLVVVTGAGGTGASTVAMAVAQHAAGSGSAVLADLSLHAEHAVLHGTPDVVPGLSELVEAHRLGVPSSESVRALTWQIGTRGYDLLLGLRRHRDWTALRQRAVAAALEGLRRSYDLVVADVDADLEGERATGSLDVEERNALARAAVGAADLVVVVGTPEMKGIHALLRVVRDVVDHGVGASRVLPLVNRAPRGPRARAELTRTIASLAGRDPRLVVDQPTHGRGALPGAVFLPDRRNLDLTIRDVAHLPDAWVRPVAAAALGLLPPSGRAEPSYELEPVPVTPGVLGAWLDEGGDDT